MGVEIKDQSFIINGKKEYIYGGEFHYFRCPKAEWADRVDKIKEAGCNLVSTYVPWYWHEMEEGRVDLTGKTRPERDLESFLQLLKEKDVYCIVRPGPYVMSEIKNEGIPDWLIQNYPEVIAKTEDGSKHPTNVVSYLHPVYLEKAKRWYQEVCQIIAPYQITEEGTVYMFQLDNETGMLQWVSNSSDYNEVTLDYFVEYLKENYKDVDTLSKTYDINISNFKEFTVEEMPNLSDDKKKYLHWDWGQFMREYIGQYINTLKEYSQNYGINIPYIVNIHGFKDISTCSRGFDYQIGLSQLYETIDDDIVFAGDFYIGNINYNNFHDLILAGEFTKAIQPNDQPYFSAEFQSGRLSDRPKLQPTDIDLSARTCIAHGMNAINYYMFVSGENYEEIGLFGRRHDWQAPIDLEGEFRPQYYKVQHLGNMMQTFGENLLDTRKEVSTYLGFYPDYYMTEFSNQSTQEMIDKLTNQRDHFQFDGIARLLTAANIPFSAYDLLQEDEIDVEEVPSLWMFSTKWMAAGIQHKLLDYVENGGKLVLYPTVPIYNLQGEDCRILADALEITDWDVAEGFERVNVLDMDSIFVNYRMILEECPGDPIAWAGDKTEEEYAGFLKDYGAGKVLMLGLGMEHDYDYKLDLISSLAERLGIAPIISSSDDSLAISIRKDEQNKFIFINNYDEIDKETVIDYQGDKLFAGQEITVLARTGLMLPVDYKLAEDIELKYSTIEIDSLTKEDKYVILSVVLSADEGELVIETDNWEPVETINNQVVELEAGYQIKVVGRTGERVEIRFRNNK
ncbi:beta-galactosidase [Halobacteroides halobius DSM 5150]|uniref:Beta-galactosidase n=1 Tax=Halobacteroides halobius (strain ATCC 35273 / DSM 5150 / MD-1) TaxID=748449 RepID=L0K5F5_HALHC|nr:beta-galactosidase [Halobacteroides halobius]AGB40246.1 beta-galactosidase [Halobacteroides halobius DSM 5150]